MNKAILHLMVGLPGSGKTTLAKQIEAAQGAIRLTPDEWQLPLFGPDFEHPDHDRRHTAVEQLMWQLAVKLLRLGLSVILDFGFWTRQERAWFFDQARLLGVGFHVHALNVTEEELLRRLAIRNADSQALAYAIGPEHLAAWFPLYEPVTEEELASYR